MRSKHPGWRTAALPFLVLLIAPATAAFAGSITFTLNPSDANDVLLVSFNLASAQTVTMQSYGYGGSANAPGGTNAAGTTIAAGGFDPYFSLFGGIGPGATLLTSNDDGACPPGDGSVWCADSTLVQPLAAGDYTLAVSVFDNFSFAENLGAGTLGDGFIGLGSYFNSALGDFTTSNGAVDILAVDLTVTSVTRLSDLTTPVPEPAPLSLLVIAAVGMGLAKRRGRSAGAKEVG